MILKEEVLENSILITELNDFIFCPASIYFHKLYSDLDTILYHGSSQMKGKAAHKAVDEGDYSTSKDILMGTNLYCEKYGLVGKLDMFDNKKGILRERKRYIKRIYDGYVFQIYAQYYSLIEMGYKVKKLQLYSMLDNKIYEIKKPEEDLKMKGKFERVIKEIRETNIEDFKQANGEKCRNCIYEPACDRRGI